MASIIRSLGNPPIRSLFLHSARSSRPLPIAFSLTPKLSYSTVSADSQSEALSNLAQLLAKQVEEAHKNTEKAHKNTEEAHKKIEAVYEKIEAAHEKTEAANKKTQTLLEERAELFKNMANLKYTARDTIRRKLQLERNLNIRGALEWITSNAVMENKISPPKPDGIQPRLNAIAKLSDFEKVLNNTASKENLVPDEIKRCAGKLFHELSKHAHGNQQPIIINSKDFTPAELAALKIFLLVQNNWPSPLRWQVQTRKDEDADYLILDL